MLLLKQGRKIEVGCKRVDAPRLTLSIQTALEYMQLEHIAVIYPGDRSYPLVERVMAVPLQSLVIRGKQALFT